MNTNTNAQEVAGREVHATPSDVSEFPLRRAAHPRVVAERGRAAQKLALYQRHLRALTAELLLTEERERRRLAVDLHDGLSQTIALAQMKLSALRRCVDGPVSEAVDEIEDLIEQANRSARSLTFELSPPVLHDLGLEPAVRWLVEHIGSRYGIEIRLQDDGQPKPADETMRVILFRSIRELLINAAKHAGSRCVHVFLWRDGNCVGAVVEDDGVGMQGDVSESHGSGLFSIRERLDHVGGRMHIESAPGRGTRISLRAPLETATTTTRAKIGA